MGLRAVVILPPNLKGYLEKLGGILDAFGELWNSRASPRIPLLLAVGVSKFDDETVSTVKVSLRTAMGQRPVGHLTVSGFDDGADSNL